MNKLHKQYVDEWLAADTEDAKIEVNKSWMFEVNGNIQFNEVLDGDDLEEAYLFPLSFNDKIKRKPKTQMINGHEVVAPRYYEPKVGQAVYYFNPVIECGYSALVWTIESSMIIVNYGWFDNEEDMKAYANAHKQGVNDE